MQVVAYPLVDWRVHTALAGFLGTAPSLRAICWGTVPWRSLRQTPRLPRPGDRSLRLPSLQLTHKKCGLSRTVCSGLLADDTPFGVAIRVGSITLDAGRDAGPCAFQTFAMIIC